ncbi:MAG: hypothetical protein Q8M88_01305 [Phenylobacterium sp.]|uniref:hypothetical protein n=1 Tax=Phenylobacterium sp. TaxID=1871053 RepID=UPI0027364211|nr:hypothetical protein [Phenylobacterium sp.]MDP3173055.1 hypothetical protein [Phenylobacterium sp.]
MASFERRWHSAAMETAALSVHNELPSVASAHFAVGASGEFLELKGASGAAYRFRAASPQALPYAGGNFVIARSAPGGSTVICCGSANSLLHATATWRDAADRHQADQLFIYLNTTRRSREQVCGDLFDVLQPVLTANIDA